MAKHYGASPLHLLAHLALLPLCAWALLEILGTSSAAGIALWLAAAVILHDLVLLPLYSGADRAAQHAAGTAINYVRIPAALSLLMLAVFYGTVAGRGERAYTRASGLTYDGYALRWLIASTALFAASALLYTLRSKR
jgi:hypothetical protein